MIWREKRILLAVLGILLVANIVFFLTYRVQYQNRVDALHQRLDQVKGELAAAKTLRASKQADMRNYQSVLKSVDMVHNEIWSTPDRRLTTLLTEIHRLSLKANLIPQSLSYSSTPDLKSGATAMGISFGVTGSYAQVRRLINLFELSPQFIIIDSVGLNGGGDTTGEGTLNLNITLRTIFMTPKTTKGATS